MNNIKANVEPCSYVFPARTIHHIELQVMNLVLFKSVTLLVSLFDENYYIIDNKTFTIADEEYTNWSNDDNYLLDLVLTKLQLNKLE